jgi:protein archease
MTWELVDHTADAAVRVRGRDLAEIMTGLAEATASLLADIARVRPAQAVPVRLAAPDREALAVALANEIIFQHDVAGLVLPRLEIERLDDTTLLGALRGDRAPARGGLKAATWHQLALRETAGGLELFLVFDV